MFVFVVTKTSYDIYGGRQDKRESEIHISKNLIELKLCTFVLVKRFCHTSDSPGNSGYISVSLTQ